MENRERTNKYALHFVTYDLSHALIALLDLSSPSSLLLFGYDVSYGFVQVPRQQVLGTEI